MSKEKKSIMAILFTAVMFLGIFFLMPTDNKAQAGSIGVTVNVTDGNGTAAVSKDSPNRGEKVIVTATPVVTSGAVYFPVISVKDSDSTSVSLYLDEDNNICFNMPEKAVTVAVRFADCAGVDTAEELSAALLCGGEYKLVGSGSKIDGKFKVYKDVTLDLNGRTIGSLTVTKSVSLTVNDSGSTGHIEGFDDNPGVLVEGGTFILNGGTVSGKMEIYKTGGGVQVRMDGNLIVNGGKITGDAMDGGAIYLESGKVEINGGEISGNADNGTDESGRNGNGGGIYIDRGEVVMNGGKIIDCSATYRGAGVYMRTGSFTMKNGEITGCIAKGKSDIATISGYFHGGGGVCVEDRCTFTMEGGVISDNFAAGRGAGVYVTSTSADKEVNYYGGYFLMKGGKITGNNSYADGAGVYIGTKGNVTVTGGEITGNYIAAPTYEWSYANSHGAGIFINSGNSVLNVSGNPVIKDNTGATEKRKYNSTAADDIYKNSRSQIITVTGALSDGVKLNIIGNCKNGEVATAAEGYALTAVDAAAFVPGDTKLRSVRASRYEMTVVETDSHGDEYDETYLYYTLNDNGNSVVFISDSSDVYDVVITAGRNMTKKSGTGEASCRALGDICPVIFTAAEGYYFPEDYSVTAVNGVSVTRNSETEITVSGTPTGNVTLVLTDASKKTADNPNTSGEGAGTTTDKPNTSGEGTETTTDKPNTSGEGTETTTDKPNTSGEGTETTTDKPNTSTGGSGTTTETPSGSDASGEKPSVNDSESKTEEKKNESDKQPVHNDDGSTTTMTVEVNKDGSVTTREETVNEDGSVTKKEETTSVNKNGSVIVETVTENADGSTIESKTKTTKSGNVTSEIVEKQADGSVTTTNETVKNYASGAVKTTTEKVETDAKGNVVATVEKTVKVAKADEEGNVKTTSTVKSTDAEGNVTTTKETVVVDAKGKASVTSVTKSADGTKEEKTFSVSSKGTVKMATFDTTAKEVEIPKTIEVGGEERPVTSIAKNAMKGNGNVTSVEIGENITSIGAGAFKNSKNLESIELTDSITKIAKNAFKGIAKNATFKIKASSQEEFDRVVDLLKASGVSDTVIFVME